MPLRESSLGADWSFPIQNGLIHNRGTPVSHEVAVTCPCVSLVAEDGAVGVADPTCEECFGKGFLFRDPVRMIGLLTNLTTDRHWSQVGWIEPGDLIFAPLTNSRRITDFDRIIVGVPVPFSGQVILRGQSSALSPRPRGLQANEDYLIWEAGRCEATWVEDEDGVVYRVGEYYLDGRRVKWSGNAGPQIGKKYTIKYEIFPEYIAFITPIDRWDRSRELGQRVMLRRATLDTNPGNRQIRPPWEEQVLNNGFKGMDDPLNFYGDGFNHKVKPQR